MRIVGLILLWLGVAGFGLMTLCSGAFLSIAPEVAVPLGLVGALLAWACWRGARALRQPAVAPPPGSDEPAFDLSEPDDDRRGPRA